MKPPPLIAWDDKLATGLAEVDAQHQRLFAITKQLGVLNASGASVEQIAACLDDLKQYAVYHFQTEEGLMSRYPVNQARRTAHLSAHQSFIQQIDRTSKLATANPDATVSLLLAFLAQWLLQHVAHVDHMLATEILAFQAGMSAEQIAVSQETYKDVLIENITEIFQDLGERTFKMLELNLQLQSEIERRKQVERELIESKMRFRTMADHTHSWEYWQGADGNIFYMSPSCERVTGYRAAEFSANPDLLYSIIHAEDRQVMLAHQKNITVQESDDEEIGFRIVRRDGEIRWIIHSCKALYGPDGTFIGRRGSNRDITDRRTQNDSMLLVAAIFESINEAVLVTDSDNRILVVNTAFTNITGYATEEVVGKDPGVLADELPEPKLVRELWKSLTGNGRWQGEMLNRRKNGDLYAAQVSIDRVCDESGEISNFVLVFSDISERKENEKRLYQLVYYDQLTNLPNWTLFSDRMQQTLQTACRKNAQMALMFVDIDRFKQAKDQLGHDIGDLLLKRVASRVQGCLRLSDMAARIGSDEFVILLPDVESAQATAIVADKILRALMAPFSLADHTVQISASIGISLYPEHGEDIGQLMKNADLAMYQAKQAGGASVMTYNPMDWMR